MHLKADKIYSSSPFHISQNFVKLFTISAIGGGGGGCGGGDGANAVVTCLIGNGGQSIVGISCLAIGGIS